MRILLGVHCQEADETLDYGKDSLQHGLQNLRTNGVGSAFVDDLSRQRGML